MLYHIISTVHVTSYLQKFVTDFRESLCGNSWIASPRNRLSGIREIVFWAPVDLSCGSPPNDHWETTGYRVREIVFSSLRN